MLTSTWVGKAVGKVSRPALSNKRSVRRLSGKAQATAAPTKLLKPLKSTVFMFTGQGSQIPGMGKDIAAQWQVAKDVFDDADDAIRMNLSARMFDGTAADLQPTPIAQPALVAHAMAVLAVLKKELKKDPVASSCCVLGHSIGEITGLAATEGINLPTAVKFAHQRGIYMAAAVPKNEQTGMAALFPLSLTQAKALCLEAVKRAYPHGYTGADGVTRSEAILDVACINSPKIIVISGEKKALETAMSIAANGEMGEKSKAILLDVSAPFHSRYMLPAHQGLKKYVNGLNIKLTTAPVISGYSTQPMRIFDQFMENFIPLTSAPVNFVGCIQQATNLLSTQSQPVENPLWIEIGPKPTLTSFVTQTLGPKAETVSLCTAEDIKNFLKNQQLVERLFPSKKKN